MLLSLSSQPLDAVQRAGSLWLPRRMQFLWGSTSGNQTTELLSLPVRTSTLFFYSAVNSTHWHSTWVPANLSYALLSFEIWSTSSCGWACPDHPPPARLWAHWNCVCSVWLSLLCGRHCARCGGRTVSMIRSFPQRCQDQLLRSERERNRCHSRMIRYNLGQCNLIERSGKPHRNDGFERDLVGRVNIIECLHWKVWWRHECLGCYPCFCLGTSVIGGTHYQVAWILDG